MNDTTKDLLYASWGDGYLTQNKSHLNDSLLKLNYDIPVMINYNTVGVAKYGAKGASYRFKEVKVKPYITIHDMETIQIDGYLVRCAAVTHCALFHIVF